MIYELKIGKTKLVVHVYKNGGKTDVYKNGEHYFSGQYFPFRKELWVPKFKFQEIINKVETSINERLDISDIISPYYKRKHD